MAGGGVVSWVGGVAGVGVMDGDLRGLGRFFEGYDLFLLVERQRMSEYLWGYLPLMGP